MYVLGIESSCDETAAAVVKDGRIICSNIIASQIDTHKIYGGVVPEVASRMHLETISYVVREALSEANLKINEIDLIGATRGPGLIGALLVGLSYGKALAFSNDIPFVGVNHMEGHISANYLDTDLEPPFISLVVSGGHTYLIVVKNELEFEVVGRTKDDAAGEAFDKIARTLGLGYPGGPYIDKYAKIGKSNIDFPRVMLKEDNYDFSFSGLKTAVLNYINSQKMKDEDIVIEDVARSFQDAVLDVLVGKTMRLSKETGINKIAVSGGVSANDGLRKRFQELESEGLIKSYFPSKVLSTDNAAMIAGAAYFQYKREGASPFSIKAVANLGL
ncbi:MAG: tRNA (adenosine(37)-N6)-threonylcarbamoyltransferase complex transferase subunit TsaD [Tissierellia bacterium]|nr:tRNA (adenosine(37)-N6)-threonylcarbamoyltransferase complex transferase subunit TsaD [Tissierellia bacterium]